MDKCPICELVDSKIAPDGAYDAALVECKRCGVFKISNTAMASLAGTFARHKDARLKVGFSLRKITTSNPMYSLTTDSLELFASSTILPTPSEQLENLIYFLGELSTEAGSGFHLGEEDIFSVGARSLGNLGFIVGAAIQEGLVDGKILQLLDNTFSIHNVKLTIKGWSVFANLKKGKTIVSQAFMAMKFHDPLLDDIYQTHFKAAVRDTGFELKRLDEGQPAGLIDDHLRVEIRKSKFLIADLTHHNNGAYWEAGYAEGLGKHVIYTCRKDVFDDKANTTHFDTNHHLTVVWHEDRLEDAVKQLKATIRATLPEDAMMEDSLSS